MFSPPDLAFCANQLPYHSTQHYFSRKLTRRRVKNDDLWPLPPSALPLRVLVFPGKKTRRTTHFLEKKVSFLSSSTLPHFNRFQSRQNHTFSGFFSGKGKRCHKTNHTTQGKNQLSAKDFLHLEKTLPFLLLLTSRPFFLFLSAASFLKEAIGPPPPLRPPPLASKELLEDRVDGIEKEG